MIKLLSFSCWLQTRILLKIYQDLVHTSKQLEKELYFLELPTLQHVLVMDFMLIFSNIFISLFGREIDR